MKFKKKTDFMGRKGYDVIIDGKIIGFVYKAVLFDLSEMWKNNSSDTLFITRKDASEDLIKF